jgi:hypothetical protein
MILSSFASAVSRSTCGHPGGRRLKACGCLQVIGVVAVLICLPACGGGGAPTPPDSGGGGQTGEHVVTGKERLGWVQQAGTFQELTAYQYWIYVNNVRAPLEGARCSYQQGLNGYSCSAPLPRLPPGRHVLELATSLTRQSEVFESARSAPVIVVMVEDVGRADVNAYSTTTTGEVAEAPAATAIALATGLRLPTAIAPLPHRRILVGERGGTVKIVDVDHFESAVSLDAGELCDAIDSEIVLHGIVLHPAFARNAFVYLMYTEIAPGDGAITRVARFRYVAGRLGERAVLLDGIPARRLEPGGAIAFGADGKLYVATDGGNLPAWRSDRSSLAGALLRLNDDGTIESDREAVPVLLRDLRRPTATGWHDGTGRPWVVDERPTAWDENLDTRDDNLDTQQRAVIHVLDSVSSACVYSGTSFALLTGKLVISRRDALHYVDVGRPASASRLLLNPGVGRIQVVQTDVSGALYLATGNTRPDEEHGRDMLVRLVPPVGPSRGRAPYSASPR